MNNKRYIFDIKMIKICIRCGICSYLINDINKSDITKFVNLLNNCVRKIIDNACLDVFNLEYFKVIKAVSNRRLISKFTVNEYVIKGKFRSEILLGPKIIEPYFTAEFYDEKCVVMFNKYLNELSKCNRIRGPCNIHQEYISFNSINLLKR